MTGSGKADIVYTFDLFHLWTFFLVVFIAICVAFTADNVRAIKKKLDA